MEYRIHQKCTYLDVLAFGHHYEIGRDIIRERKAEKCGKCATDVGSSVDFKFGDASQDHCVHRKGKSTTKGLRDENEVPINVDSTDNTTASWQNSRTIFLIGFQVGVVSCATTRALPS